MALTLICIGWILDQPHSLSHELDSQLTLTTIFSLALLSSLGYRGTARPCPAHCGVGPRQWLFVSQGAEFAFTASPILMAEVTCPECIHYLNKPKPRAWQELAKIEVHMAGERERQCSDDCPVTFLSCLSPLWLAGFAGEAVSCLKPRHRLLPENRTLLTP